MRIGDIDALLATTQFSSLDQAAEYLGIVQSTITRRPQRLEQKLSVMLLGCQVRPLILTVVRHRVYEWCLSIKHETKKFYSLLDPRGKPHGALCLGVPQSLSKIASPVAPPAPSQQFPGLSPQITYGWNGQLQHRPENNGLGSMLAMGPAQQSLVEGHSGHLPCPLEVMPTVGRRLNLRTSFLREYTEQSWIPSPDGCDLRVGLIRKLRGQGSRLELDVESTDTQLQIALVAQGLGLGLAPQAAPANGPWWGETAVLNPSDLQPTVLLRLTHTQYLTNLQPPLTFFTDEAVQQLTISD